MTQNKEALEAYKDIKDQLFEMADEAGANHHYLEAMGKKFNTINKALEQAQANEAAVRDLSTSAYECSVNIEVLLNVINDPDRGNALQKSMVILVARDTLERAEKALKDHAPAIKRAGGE